MLYHSGPIKKINNLCGEFLYPPGGAVAYIINKNAAKILLELAFPLRLPADALLGRAIYNKKLLGYGLIKETVKHNDQNYSYNNGGGYKINFIKRIRLYLKKFLFLRNINYKSKLKMHETKLY